VHTWSGMKAESEAWAVEQDVIKMNKM